MKLFNRSEPSVKRTAILSVTALCLAAISALTRTLCLFFFYDEIGYFKTGAVLPVIFNVIYTLSILFFAFCSICFSPITPKANPGKPEKLSSLIVCAAFVPLIITKAVSTFGASGTDKPSLIAILSVVFALLSAAYFASLAFCKQPSAISVMLGVACIIWAVISWISSYLDFFVPMNSPDKLFFHFACIGAILVVFADIRAIYGIPRPKMYFFSFCAGLVALCTSSLPSIIANAKNLFASYSLLYEDIAFLAIAIYAAVRLLTHTGDEKSKSDSDGTDAE